MKRSHGSSCAGGQGRYGLGRKYGRKTPPTAASSKWRATLVLPVVTLFLLFCAHAPPVIPLTASDLLNGSAQYTSRLQSARFSLQVDGPLSMNPYQLQSAEGTVVRQGGMSDVTATFISPGTPATLEFLFVGG